MIFHTEEEEKRYMKKQKTIVFSIIGALIAIVLVMVIGFTLHDKSQIDKVYNGYLQINPDKPIGTTIDSYLENEKWKYENLGENKYVTVTGEDKKSNHLKIKFFMKNDGGFSLSEIELNGRECGQLELYYIMLDIFDEGDNLHEY